MSIDTPLTMSSREIADLVDKRHDNVMADVRTMLEALELAALNFQGSYTGLNGKALPCFNLPRDLTMTLVTGYSIPLRKRVIDRLDELERRPPAFDVPSTLSQALRLAADQADVIERQTAAIAVLAPKAQFHDDVAVAVNGQTFMDVAKIFGTGRTRFTAWLRDRGFLQKNNRPYQQYEDAGYFRVVEKKRKGPDTGEVFTYPQTLISGKGVTYLHRKWLEDHPQAQESLALTDGEGK